jgi:hypothetical protein
MANLFLEEVCHFPNRRPSPSAKTGKYIVINVLRRLNGMKKAAGRQ